MHDGGCVPRAGSYGHDALRPLQWPCGRLPRMPYTALCREIASCRSQKRQVQSRTNGVLCRWLSFYLRACGCVPESHGKAGLVYLLRQTTSFIVSYVAGLIYDLSHRALLSKTVASRSGGSRSSRS